MTPGAQCWIICCTGLLCLAPAAAWRIVCCLCRLKLSIHRMCICSRLWWGSRGGWCMESWAGSSDGEWMETQLQSSAGRLTPHWSWDWLAGTFSPFSLFLRDSSLHCVLWVPGWRRNCSQGQGSSGYLRGDLPRALFPEAGDPPP